MKLKKGDTVVVTVGKDKGRQGTVERVVPKTSGVVVEGVNQFKKHIKKSATGQPSEIRTITKPLAAGKVALICPKCKKPTRVGFEIGKTGKVRICRKCGKGI